MRFVMKFGGTSVGDAEGIRRAVKIIDDQRSQGHEIVAVVSALPGVTDEILSSSKKAVDGNLTVIKEYLEKLQALHHETANRCIRDRKVLTEVEAQLSRVSNELGETLRSVGHLRELTPRSLDFLLTFGEKFSAPIFCGSAKDAGLNAVWFTGGDAGITTDEHFGEAKPLMEVTSRKVKAVIEPLLKDGKLPIVAGYGACSPHGIETTLGRGGSDYTATILGASLKADEVIIWKDVDGLMTADPKIEPGAKVIPKISYEEASELAYFGTKALHPKALEPAANKQIPIRVKSSLHPSQEGTLIASDRSVRSQEIVKAVTLVDNVGMISVAGAGMTGLPGVAARVFKTLGDAGISILMISQSSSEADISFVAPMDKLQTATNKLELELMGTEFVSDVSAESNVCVIAAVGAGMKGTPGVAARIFKAVSDNGINVRMIAQGSSELNISFVVSREDGAKAVRALHREFALAN
jgi:aspartate kinase